MVEPAYASSIYTLNYTTESWICFYLCLLCQVSMNSMPGFSATSRHALGKPTHRGTIGDTTPAKNSTGNPPGLTIETARRRKLGARASCSTTKAG